MHIRLQEHYFKENMLKTVPKIPQYTQYRIDWAQMYMPMGISGSPYYSATERNEIWMS